MDGRIGLSQFLVVSQIALSLLLVLGAALFVRTLANLHSVEIGFNQENLLTFSLDASQAGYEGRGAEGFYAGMDETAPSSSRRSRRNSHGHAAGRQLEQSTHVILPGAPKPEGRDGPSTSYISVGPTFFETMQLPILLGRPIDSRDVDGAPLAAVVNEVFAKKYFPNQNPIGRQFGLGNSEAGGDMTIVGVARNARYNSLKQAIPPVAYIPYLQNDVKRPPSCLVLRTAYGGKPSGACARPFARSSMKPRRAFPSRA